MSSEHEQNIDRDNMSISFEEERTPPNFVTQRATQAQKRGTESNTEGSLTDQFTDFKEEMRKLVTFFVSTHKEELASLNSTLKEIR